ncbi:hypothetical protein JYT51_02250, partial [Candidatus Amoebophilus asiaticus]|nr:hypothetical protein [Candidatus Amoebophilus asiaticus]
MSKRLMWSIIVLSSLSLIGLVGIQLYWIDHAIKQKEKHFNQCINECLNNIVKKLEKDEVVLAISNEIGCSPHQSLHFFDKSDSIMSGVDLIADSFFKKNTNLIYKLMAKKGSTSLKLRQFINESDSGKDEKYMISLAIQNADVIIDSNKKYRKKHKNYFKLKLRKSIDKQSDFVQNVIAELLEEDKGIEDRIDLNRLDTLIKSELGNQGID